MSVDKTNPKYKTNPKLHYMDLCKFRDRLIFLLLGEEDKEWRGQLEFLLIRTNKKIQEVKEKFFWFSS